MTPLTDAFGRIHTNLRVSVTDRCNLRCVYCMPEDVTFLDKGELLTFEELAAVVQAGVSLGIRKVRLTGGEPLLRRDLPAFVRMLSDVSELSDIGLTSNGLLLAGQAEPLWDAGLRHLNVSLDTLDPDRFRKLARRDGLNLVLDGLAAAKRVGFGIKVNAVALREVIDHDAAPLARFCREHGFELRFIESMPIGADPWDRTEFVAAYEILDLLDAQVCPLVPAADRDPHAPATTFDYADGRGRVGVIASVSKPFCGKCDRLRITADGKLRNCLFSLDEVDVKGLVRSGKLHKLPDAFRVCVAGKRAGHGIDTPAFEKPRRTMHTIGG